MWCGVATRGVAEERTMKTPDLKRYPVDEVLAALRGERPDAKLMTMSDGEPWDAMLDAGYEQGFILVVYDSVTGEIVKAYRKEKARAAGA
jgi:hypothetical protein